jgi:4-hydroxy-tetrahydrodipicolinate synthase
MGGIYVLPPAPFDDNRRFDEERMRHNVRALCEAGVDAIVTTGSVGEFHTISWEDHKKLIEVLVDEVTGKTKAIPGCSGVNTEEAIKKVKYAQDCGADAVMNVSPYYVRIADNELIGFWRDLAEACPDIGLIVYNNPGTSQLHTSAHFIELAKIPTMCGSKETTTLQLQLEIMRHTDLAPMTATELDYFVPTIMCGAKGIFSMMASAFPRFIIEFYQTCKEGKWEKAWEMQHKLRDVSDYLSGHQLGREYGSISRFKCIVNAFGVLDCGITGKPFIPVPKDVQDKYREVIEKEYPELIEA